MSALLDILCGPARLQECAKHSDAYLTQTAAGFAIVPGSELSHADWVEVDRQYLRQQQERIRRREQETAALEQSYFSRIGWQL
jgi:hypothetical protein